MAEQQRGGRPIAASHGRPAATRPSPRASASYFRRKKVDRIWPWRRSTTSIYKDVAAALAVHHRARQDHPAPHFPV